MAANSSYATGASRGDDLRRRNVPESGVNGRADYKQLADEDKKKAQKVLHVSLDCQKLQQTCWPPDKKKVLTSSLSA